MIRLRKSDGTSTTVEPGTFVEIADLDGKVSLVVFQTRDGIIHTLESGSPDAKRYASLFKLDLCPEVRL